MIWIVLIVLLTGLLYVGVQIRKGYKLVYEGSHPKRSQATPSIPQEAVQRRFSFVSRDGLQLAAIEYRPIPPVKGTVIACHYLGGSKTSIYPYLEPLLRHGYRVVAFDYPNHGESQNRKRNRYTLEDDMRRFLLRLQELQIPGPYATMGFSMGATIAISALDHLPEIRAVIVDSGPLLFVRDYFHYLIQNKKIKNRIAQASFLFLYLYVAGFLSMSQRMRKRLAGLRGIPILFIQSRRDRIIPYKNAELAYALCQSENAQFLVVDKAHHLTNRVVLGETYDLTVLRFLDKWMNNNEKTSHS